MRGLSLLLLTGALAAGLGCVSARGTIPSSPGTAELRNDGSEEQEKALLDRYEVRLGQRKVTVGTAERPRTGWPDLDVDEEVRAYLEADPGAAGKLVPSRWKPAGYGGLVLVAAAAVPVIATVVLQAALFGATLSGALDVPALGGFGLSGVLAVIGVACGAALLLAGGTLVAISLDRLGSALESAVESYNRGLRERIRSARAGPDAHPADTPPAKSP